MEDFEKIEDAIRAARMYYYQNLTTDAIAHEMNVSRSTISRLLSFARQNGLVDIRIADPNEHPQQFEKIITDYFKIIRAHVVPVKEVAGEAEWLEQVAQYTASYLNSVFESNMILGIAWGTTVSGISRHLLPKVTHDSQIVQLNGAGNTQTMGIEYASEIVRRFAQNFQAVAHLFPVPTFFDFADTKQAYWKEGSIQRLIELQKKADLFLYSIGAVNAGIPSHVYSGGYLDREDYAELKENHIVGDIATIFFRKDGSYQDISLNARSSGPDLELFKQKHGICVVSGLAKVKGVFSALQGHLISELIIDEPTARNLIENYVNP
jgi:deoxyribonucleoside regulator